MSDIHPRSRGGFIENTLEGLHFAMERFLYGEASASGRHVIERLDPRVKLGGVLAIVVAVALATKLWLLSALLVSAIALAVASKIPLRVVASRAWVGALIFSGAIALPALFLTPGTDVGRLPVTLQGLRTAGFLLLRTETATTMMLVLAYTTPWMHILKALRIFRVPVVLVVILGMTCRYILLLLGTAHEMFESRKSRKVNTLSPAESRRLAISSCGVLLTKTVDLSGEVYLAMQARGFRGEVYLLDDFEMRARDWLAAGTFASVAVAAIILGR